MKTCSEVRMVDVGGKGLTERIAMARGRVQLGRKVFRLLMQGQLPKGDVLAVAKIAGIQGAKKTSEIIPLCHPLSIDRIDVRFHPDPEKNEIAVEAEVKAMERTGVEMEALMVVASASLTIYDMCKGIDKSIVISDIRLVSKRGGKSGDYHLD
ncbi:MAG: cyclic pyranopterin monophosphate synthase MoaC [Acidobacteriota bacterium]